MQRLPLRLRECAMLLLLAIRYSGVAAQLDVDAIVLQQNHSIYDLPKGIVVEMFSNEFCTGDATLVPQDRCMRLGFDEWQVFELGGGSMRVHGDP